MGKGLEGCAPQHYLGGRILSETQTDTARRSIVQRLVSSKAVSCRFFKARIRGGPGKTACALGCQSALAGYQMLSPMMFPAPRSTSHGKPQGTFVSSSRHFDADDAAGLCRLQLACMMNIGWNLVVVHPMSHSVGTSEPSGGFRDPITSKRCSPVIIGADIDKPWPPRVGDSRPTSFHPGTHCQQRDVSAAESALPSWKASADQTEEPVALRAWPLRGLSGACASGSAEG